MLLGCHVSGTEQFNDCIVLVYRELVSLLMDACNKYVKPISCICLSHFWDSVSYKKISDFIEGRGPYDFLPKC